MANYDKIIGRQEQIKALEDAYTAKTPQFVAVYGRRRVGKTYLIKEVFKDRFSFVYTGISKISNREQLSNFRLAMVEQGHEKCPVLKNWFEAFHQLAVFIDGMKTSRKVIFIDELPWLDARASRFIPAFENFWNGWANYRDDVLLIVCGSATSWIVNKVINSHGGLHNRLTEQIYLSPFNLAECEEYLVSRNIKMSRFDIAQAYMILGGIPYYLSLLKKGKSLARNINDLCFKRGGALTNEYQKLYDSLFNNPEPYLNIIMALKGKICGMTRDEIAHKGGIPNNGHLSRYLADLEQCDFIRRYNSIGNKKKDCLYQLIDNFTIFYHCFMDRPLSEDADYWAGMSNTGEYRTWSGLAFERLCLWHIPQIKRALGIFGVLTNMASWRTTPAQAKEYGGAQVDMAIVRADGIINMCEMKFSKSKYIIDKKEDSKLRQRESIFETLAAGKRAVHLTMITPFGVKQNSYSSIVQSEVTLDDLF